jgi:RNA polymerase primary sigma factor
MAGETGLGILEFRKIVHVVQKGEREARQAKKKWWRSICDST